MRSILLCTLLICALVISGCGSSAPKIAVSLTPGSAQNADGGQAISISATVSNDPGNKGVTWALTGAGTLSGQTATSVTYTAPATIASSGTATVTATSVADTTAVASVTINLQPVVVTISPSTPQTLEPSQKVSLTATAANDLGNKGVTWTLTGGGALSGQTATVATYTAPAAIAAASTATVTATSVADGTKTAQLTINLTPPPSVTTASLPNGTVGTAYSATLAVSGGVSPFTWTLLSGTLPAGVSLSTGGVISGTPSAYGTSTFTVQVKDSLGGTATANLSLKINPPPLSVTTSSLPTGAVNSAYSTTLAATGGAPPYTWSITVGTLPAGLTLTGATISGTPTASGTFPITVQVADSLGTTATANLSITINPALSVTTTSLPAGTTGTAYSATLAASGGVSPYTWTVTLGTLPSGLSLSTAGVISGTPTVNGTSNFTVQVKDSLNATATANLSITVNPAPLSITTTSLAAGTQGSPYSQTLAATGGVQPYTWAVTVGTLPTGLSLNVSTGAITGTPSATGTSSFTVQVTDSQTPTAKTATANLSITINAPPPLVVNTTSSSLPAGVVNSAYPNTNLAASGGVPPYTWSVTVGAPPAGLTISTAGVISGTPTTAGSSTFTVQVKDSVNATATASLTITVLPANCGAALGNESLLKGQYAFFAQGMVGTGATSPVAFAGSFTADGTGKITAGEVDIIRTSGPSHLTIVTTGNGNYTVGSDSRGCLALATSSGMGIFRVALGGVSAGIASKGHMIEFTDTNGTGERASGILRLQTPSAFSLSQLQPHYAFGLDGFDTAGGHVGVDGNFAASTTGTLTGVTADVNDAGTVSGPLTGGSGSFSAINSNGRATVSLAVTGFSLHFAAYVVSSNLCFLVSTDVPAAANPIIAGRAFATGSTFSAATLSGNYIFHMTGTSAGSADATLGLVTINGAGSVSGTSYDYVSNSASFTSNPIPASAYTVDAASGRFVVTNGPVGYITGGTDGINAILLDRNVSADFGFLEFQPAGPYSTSSLSGSFFFGTEDPSDNTVRNESGVVTVSAGSVTGTSDQSGPVSPFLATNKPISATLTINSDGSGNVGPGSIGFTNGTKFFFFNSGTGQPAVIRAVEK